MDRPDINQIVSSNINRLMEKNNTTQQELADYVGVSQTTVSNWCSGIKMPRMDKVDKICRFFGVGRSALMDEVTTSTYYLDPTVAEMAQQIHDNPDLRILFDASRKVSREDMQLVVDMVNRLKGQDDD